eukprot:scaffold2771_cov252-Pinguiococcus_pyrenoidosus.AAC.36
MRVHSAALVFLAFGSAHALRALPRGLPRLGSPLLASQLAGPADEVEVPKPAESANEPSMGQIIRFSLPTLGIYLCNPLLSLIDTAFVGNFAKSPNELAALGPATAICDQLSSVFFFLAVATTNILARAIANKDEKEIVRGPVHGLYIGAGLGVVFSVLLQLFAPAAIRAFVGADAPAQLIAEGVSYVRIRALAIPCALATLVAQAGCLGGKDSISALKACGLASVINAIGDLILVWGLDKGVAGAAIATAVSQVVAAYFMTRALFVNVLRYALLAKTGNGWGGCRGGQGKSWR